MEFQSIGNLWQQTPQVIWGVLAWRAPLYVGLFLFVVLIIATLHYKRRFNIILRISLLGVIVTIVVSSLALTWLQYKAFLAGHLRYALPPYQPLQEYFLPYVFFYFWLPWLVGFGVSAIISVYFWLIKRRSEGIMIGTEEIIVFVLFGTLTSWPGILVYISAVFTLYIASLLLLNLIRLKVLRSMLNLMFKPFGRLIFFDEKEIRIPIFWFFIFSAPVALLLTPAIMRALNLTWVYIAPRLIGN